MSDRRRAERIPLNLPVTLIVGNDPTEATLMNVSVDGMFLQSAVRLYAGTEVNVQFVQRNGAAPCNATGKVVWRGDYGIGIDLLNVNDAFVAFVDALAHASAASLEQKRALLDSLLYPPEIEVPPAR